MNRSGILVVGLTAAVGLALGFLGVNTGPTRTLVGKPAPVVAATPARIEFALGRDDLANDRETPAIAADAAGHVVLAWARQSGPNERTIMLARSTDRGRTFDTPRSFRKVPIFKYASKGKTGSVTYSTHVLPRLAATGQGLFLSWVEAAPEGPPVILYLARSTDGGQTFDSPVPAHGSSAVKPGFTTLAATADGALLAAWIDARNHAQQPFFAAKPADSTAFEPERLVFAGPDEKGICPCCDLAAARLPDGSDVVAFRNSDAGHRDIWIARAPRNGEFQPPTALTAERWTFDGCPHDGPSLAVRGDRLLAVWMSAHSGRNRVYFGDSPTSELSFSARELSPQTLGAQGHPKLVATADGAMFAAWDESLEPASADNHAAAAKSGHHHGPVLTGLGRAVMFAVDRSGTGGFNKGRPVAPRDGAFQLNPALAVASDGALLVAFSELDTNGKRIVVVRREPNRRAR